MSGRNGTAREMPTEESLFLGQLLALASRGTADLSVPDVQFRDFGNRTIAEASRSILAEGGMPTIDAVADRVRDKLPDVGGYERLAELYESGGSGANLEYYARRLTDRRRFESVAGDVAGIMAEMTSADAEPGEVSDEFVRRISEVVAGYTPSGVEKELYPEPKPISQCRDRDESNQWLWEGYVGRNEITLLSALWKAGKTTLLSHLFRAMEAGGEFCGRKVEAGPILVLTEEPEHLWADRRRRVGIADHVRVQERPWFGVPSRQDWERYVGWLIGSVRRNGYQMVLIDTISGYWPVRDENSSADVQAAFMPLRKLANEAALVLCHHLRKGDGGEFTGTRGSGALLGAVDTIIELRPFTPDDDDDRRRVLRAKGRWDDTPRELVVELSEDGKHYTAQGTRKDAQRNELVDNIKALMVSGEMYSFDGIKQALADEGFRPSKKPLLDALKDGVQEQLWVVTGTGKRGDPFMYHTG